MPMQVAGVKVTIAGKERCIRFTFDALLAASAKLDLPMGDVVPMDLLQRQIPDLKPHVFLELLAAGLLHEDPRMSAKAARALLDADPRCYYPVTGAIAAAWWEAQAQLLPPDVYERVQRTAAGGDQGEAPPPPSTGGDFAGGPTEGSSSGSAAGTGSPST